MLKANGQRKSGRTTTPSQADETAGGEIILFPGGTERRSGEEHPDQETVSRWLKLADELLGKEEDRKKA